ncbi:hypothetical protein [Chroogloeocystis siderophila]|uniref:hypothetical protein n=1 Tax=Chroogloeocystis siderophila TaxID=329163 RepID=UPI0015BA4D29|nr:hypothetical protein [Chroogloeocystis siderophila]
MLGSYELSTASTSFHCCTAADTNVSEAESVHINVMRIPSADIVPEHCPLDCLPD